MKKNMIFAAIAALALTACSNDDDIKVGGDNAILLTSSLDVAETRAATNIQTSAFDATSPYWQQPRLAVRWIYKTARITIPPAATA